MTTRAPETDDENVHPRLQPSIDKFDQWSQRYLSGEDSRNRVAEPLYHYTSAAGLKGIVESQKLWFTDYRHLNDPTELRYGIEQARHALGLEQAGVDGRVGLFVRMVADLLSLENLDTLSFFVGSFTRARDDLSQWRAYADNGRGFAIGYAPTMFTVVSTLRPSPDENAFRARVIYDRDRALARNTLAIRAAASIFIEAADANADLLRDRCVGMHFMRILAQNLIASVLIWNALTTKHSAYEREDEVRLIILGTADALQPVTRTRVRGSEIVPFVPHPWLATGPEKIAEIVVGPAAPTDTERTVRALLQSSGIMNIPIVRSAIPYRAA